MSWPNDPPDEGAVIAFPGGLTGTVVNIMKDNSYGKYIAAVLKPDGNTEMLGIELINGVWTATEPNLTIFPDLDGVLKNL